MLLCLSVRQRRTPAGGERECRAAPLPLLANQHPTVPELSFFSPEQLCELKAAGTGRLAYQPFGMTSLRALLLPTEE